MVSTKHCCWGKCTSDSRYPDRLPKSLQEMQKIGKKIFIPFPKPSQGVERCQRWINACSRRYFTVKNITRNTYVCALHWPGEQGPTEEFPDPLKANLTAKEMDERAGRSKRKAPRIEPVRKYAKHDLTNDNETHETDISNNAEDFDLEVNNDKSTQTVFAKVELASKIETMISKNQSAIASDVVLKVVINISYEVIRKDAKKMKHFTGLTNMQFDVLYNFLDDICPLNEIRYWSCNRNGQKVSRVSCKLPEWSSKEKLFICLLRLRRGFTIKTMSLLLSCPGKEIKETSIRDIFTTFIQMMYKIFRQMNKVMFPSRDKLRKYLPKVFKTMKNTRCSVDCTEFKVETSRNFGRQGNAYSSYKHGNTFKCMIAVTPSGGACFVSDLFEGDISDVQLFEESGILKHIDPGDIILADRGFTVQDLVNPLQAHVNIPAFLKGRTSLSAAEELSTRKIAKARIHVERFNQRLKQFKLVGRTIPLSLAPLATQMVVVACALVNFQQVLCK